MAGAVVGVEGCRQVAPGNFRHDVEWQGKGSAVHGCGGVIECGEGCVICGHRYGIGDAALDVGDGAGGVEERKAAGLGRDAVAIGTFGNVGQRFEIDTAG